MYLLPPIFKNSSFETKRLENPFAALTSQIPISYTCRESRHQDFQDTLERHLNTIEQYGLLGFRSTLIAATQSLTNLDSHERFRLEINFFREAHPLKRLLIASVLNSEFHRDNLKTPQSGTRAAHEFYRKELLASLYEFAFLFRGLTPAIDSWLNAHTAFNVGQRTVYYTSKDPLFLKVVNREKLSNEKLSCKDLIAWTKDLTDKINSKELEFTQAYEIIKDLYIFRAITTDTLLAAFHASETTLSQKSLLSGAFSLLDTGLKNKLYKDTFKPWLTSRSITERNLVVALYWGSDSRIVSNDLVKLLTSSEKLQSDPSYFPDYFFDIFLLACTLTTNPMGSDPLSTITENIKKIFEGRAAENYDDTTRKGFKQQPTAKQLKKRGMVLSFDDHGLVSARGERETINGMLMECLDQETLAFSHERSRQRQATIAAEASEAIGDIFSIKRASEIAGVIDRGELTLDHFVEELFVYAKGNLEFRATPAIIAMSAHSINQGRLREANRRASS